MLQDNEEWELKYIYILEFGALKDILLQEAQSYREFKSFCKMVQSSTLETPWYNFVSWAKLTMLEEDMPRLIYTNRIIKRSGPKTVPCRTLLSTGLSRLTPPCNFNTN